MSSRVLAVVAVLVAIAAVVAMLADFGTSEEPTEEARTLDEVLALIRGGYVNKGDLATEDLLNAAIRGVIEELNDPYSSYTTPQLYEITFNYSGQFEGIGAEVTSRDGLILIQAPLPGSPAEGAGLLPGDVILGVDGESIAGFTIFEAVALIRGPKDSTVVLSILRTGSAEPFDVSVERDTITLTSVTSRLVDGSPHIGYIRLSAYESATPGQLREAIADLRSQGAEALVLDLRNNGGGLVDAGVAVTGEFIDGGLVVSLVDSDGARTDFEASDGGSATDLPLAVLVNAFTASAAEFTTGALQDQGRATIVGSRTFGKGSFNTAYPLANGGGLFLTTGRWLTPDGRLIEGEGLEPDVAVGPPSNTQELIRIGGLVQALCSGYGGADSSAGANPEVLDAIEALCSIEAPPPADGDADEALDVAVSLLDRELGR